MRKRLYGLFVREEHKMVFVTVRLYFSEIYWRVLNVQGTLNDDLWRFVLILLTVVLSVIFLYTALPLVSSNLS